MAFQANSTTLATFYEYAEYCFLRGWCLMLKLSEEERELALRANSTTLATFHEYAEYCFLRGWCLIPKLSEEERRELAFQANSTTLAIFHEYAEYCFLRGWCLRNYTATACGTKLLKKFHQNFSESLRLSTSACAARPKTNDPKA